MMMSKYEHTIYLVIKHLGKALGTMCGQLDAHGLFGVLLLCIVIAAVCTVLYIVSMCNAYSTPVNLRTPRLFYKANVPGVIGAVMLVIAVGIIVTHTNVHMGYLSPLVPR